MEKPKIFDTELGEKAVAIAHLLNERLLTTRVEFIDGVKDRWPKSGEFVSILLSPRE